MSLGQKSEKNLLGEDCPPVFLACDSECLKVVCDVWRSLAVVSHDTELDFGGPKIDT